MKRSRSMTLDECAIRMTAFLATPPRSRKTRKYLSTMPKRERIVVCPDDYPRISRSDARSCAALQAVRDAQRYSDWERRGKPPSPSAPRKDRLRPGASRGRELLRAKLHAAQDGLCGLCGDPICLPSDGTIDHVVPRALGGGNSRNVLLAHGECNNLKADRSPTAEELTVLAIVNARLTESPTS